MEDEATFDLQLALQRTRFLRATILNALGFMYAIAVRAGDTQTADGIEAARQGLLDITKLPALLAATSDAEFDTIALARYRQLAGAAPATVRSAFLGAAS